MIGGKLEWLLTSDDGPLAIEGAKESSLASSVSWSLLSVLPILGFIELLFSELLPIQCIGI